MKGWVVMAVLEIIGIFFGIKEGKERNAAVEKKAKRKSISPAGNWRQGLFESILGALPILLSSVFLIVFLLIEFLLLNVTQIPDDWVVMAYVGVAIVLSMLLGIWINNRLLKLIYQPKIKAQASRLHGDWEEIGQKLDEVEAPQEMWEGSIHTFTPYGKYRVSRRGQTRQRSYKVQSLSYLNVSGKDLEINDVGYKLEGDVLILTLLYQIDGQMQLVEHTLKRVR